MNAGIHANQVKDEMKKWCCGGVKCPNGHPCALPVRVPSTNPMPIVFL
jgi:hypothetical protein